MIGVLVAALWALAASGAESEQPPSYYLFVFSAPVAGKEAAFNKWYDEQHVPDVTAVPGFVSAQRFQLAEQQLRAGSPSLPKYLVLYKIVTADLNATYAEVNRRVSSGATRMSDALDMQSLLNRTYRVIRPEPQGNAQLTGKAAAGNQQVYYQFVFGEAKAGQEQVFNDWYDRHHAPDVLAVPGFVWGQRMQLNAVQMTPDVKAQTYLMMFRIETADLAATFADFGTLAPKMTMSPSFDGDHTFGYTYQVFGPQLDGNALRAARVGKQ